MAEATFEAIGDGRFRVGGELTFETVGALLLKSRPLLQTGAADRLDLDLGDVSRTDSAGVALLIEWLRTARKLGKEILFRRVPPQIQTMATVSDLEGILPFAPAG